MGCFCSKSKEENRDSSSDNHTENHKKDDYHHDIDANMMAATMNDGNIVSF